MRSGVKGRRLVSVLLSLAVPAGPAACNAVFGIDEAHVDPAFGEERDAEGAQPLAGDGQADAAVGAGGSAMRDDSSSAPDAAAPDATTSDATAAAADAGASLCSDYCSEIMSRCTGELEQYIDTLQCLRVCALFDEGSLEEPSGNTVACRLRMASKTRYAAGTELAAFCRQAGPGGAGVCGSDCEAYCSLMSRVCPEETAGHYHFETDSECLASCRALPTTEVAYSTRSEDVFDGDHVKCRLFHVTSAAMLDPEEHCEHAYGVTLCEATE